MMFNQVLSMCFRGVIIDINVESYVDCSVVLLSTVMFNQMLTMYFGGVVIDSDVHSSADYVLWWCCYRQRSSIRC